MADDFAQYMARMDDRDEPVVPDMFHVEHPARHTLADFARIIPSDTAEEVEK